MAQTPTNMVTWFQLPADEEPRAWEFYERASVAVRPIDGSGLSRTPSTGSVFAVDTCCPTRGGGRGAGIRPDRMPRHATLHNVAYRRYVRSGDGAPTTVFHRSGCAPPRRSPSRRGLRSEMVRLVWRQAKTGCSRWWTGSVRPCSPSHPNCSTTAAVGACTTTSSPTRAPRPAVRSAGCAGSVVGPRAAAGTPLPRPPGPAGRPGAPGRAPDARRAPHPPRQVVLHLRHRGRPPSTPLLPANARPHARSCAFPPADLVEHA